MTETERLEHYNRRILACSCLAGERHRRCPYHGDDRRAEFDTTSPAEVLIYGMAAAHPRIQEWAAMTEAEQDEVIREAREREIDRSVAESKARREHGAVMPSNAMLGEVAGFLTQAAEMAYGAGEYRLAYDIGVMARRAEKTAKTKEPNRG